jgi:hypothetical protein
VDEDELGKELNKDLEDFPWEREAAWLRMEEALSRERAQNPSAWESVSFDELKRRCREVFDACFFDMCASHEDVLAALHSHAQSMAVSATVREAYTLKLETALRALGIEVPPAPPWDTRKLA